jgi:hypothetical protein
MTWTRRLERGIGGGGVVLVLFAWIASPPKAFDGHRVGTRYVELKGIMRGPRGTLRPDVVLVRS